MAATIGEGQPARAAWPWQRGAHARVAVVLLVSGVYLVAVALNALTLLAPPRLSLALDSPGHGGSRVAWVLPGGTLWEAGVRAGDRVIALDGHPVSVDAGLWTGRHVVVQDAQGRIAVDASAVRSGHSTWPLLVLSPWFLFMGTLVLLRAPRPEVGRATYAMFASAAAALTLAPGADNDRAIAAVVEFAAVPLFAACFVLFVLTFPIGIGRRARFWRMALFCLPACVGLLGLMALWWPGIYAPAAILRLAVVLSYLLLGMALLGRSLATQRERATRRGLMVICAGMAASVCPFIALYLLPTVFGHAPLMPAEVAILALAVLPACFAYAILRHRALDVHLLQRWILHGGLYAALVAAAVAIMVALSWLPHTLAMRLGHPLAGLITMAIIAGGVGIPFSVLHNWLWPLLNRLVFKDSYDYRVSLRAFSHDLSVVGDLSAVGASLPHTLRRLMNLDFVALFVRDRHGETVSGAAGITAEALLTALLEVAADVEDEPRIVAPTTDHPAILVIPLRTHGVVVGHLCLGPKANGEPLRSEDQALLQTLSGHLAAIVHNIQLVADLRATVADLQIQQQAVEALNARLQRAREEERASLAADLHDEPLQTAIDLRRHLLAHDGAAATVRYAARAQTLIDQLRALCLRMRPAALDELGLHAALDMLAMDVSERGGVRIELSPSTEWGDVCLAPATELMLYRAAQEALANSVRHARAHTIRIELSCREAEACLTITDDGIGFAVPDRFEELARQGHLGLAGLQQRVRHAGGCLHVTSVPGHGTTVQVLVSTANAEAME